MLTKWCYDCRQFKRVELFDIDRHRRRDGRSAQCKACRRQRQNRCGYAVSRDRALRELAARYPDEHRRYQHQARLELAPGTAPAEVWDRARALALAELSRRHQTDWHQRYQQLRASHPTWSSGRVYYVAINQQRHAHREEFLELLISYAGARIAGAKLVGMMTRRAQRLLQLAHPEEYQVLYAAERARIGNPIQPPHPAAPSTGRPAQRRAAPRTCRRSPRPRWAACEQDSPTGTGGTIPSHAQRSTR
jgi:hypothetical protein